MARKKTRKKPARRPRSRARVVVRTTKCKYVATRGNRLEANRIAGELKSAGYRPLVSRTYGAARVAWTVFSCGKLKGR